MSDLKRIHPLSFVAVFLFLFLPRMHLQDRFNTALVISTFPHSSHPLFIICPSISSPPFPSQQSSLLLVSATSHSLLSFVFMLLGGGGRKKKRKEGPEKSPVLPESVKSSTLSVFLSCVWMNWLAVKIDTALVLSLRLSSFFLSWLFLDLGASFRSS